LKEGSNMKNKMNCKKWLLQSIFIVILFLFLFSWKQKQDLENSPDLSLSILIDGENSQNYPPKNAGYLYEKLTCDKEIIAGWNEEKWYLNVAKVTAPTQCTISFVSQNPPQNLKDQILKKEGGIDQIKAKPSPDFSKIATSDEGMFATTDDYGTSYYYRGKITDNYVQVGNYLWRIVRIAGNGSIRLIYEKSLKDQTTLPFRVKYNPASKTPNQFNAFVGYMYGDILSSNYQSTHQNTYNSVIKSAVDDWYLFNFQNNSSHLADNIFCNDRSLGPGFEQTGYGTRNTKYAIQRLQANSPTLQCQNQNDRFTVSDTTIGNGALDYPVGLLTADELIYAGAVLDQTNKEYYLYIGETWWTMTPAQTYDYPIVCTAESSSQEYSLYCSVSVGNSGGNIGIRPVINLKAETTFVKGSGTKENPYVVI